MCIYSIPFPFRKVSKALQAIYELVRFVCPKVISALVKINYIFKPDKLTILLGVFLVSSDLNLVQPLSL